MEVKILAFSPSKTFREDGSNMKINVHVRLNDDCKNGHYDFSITGDVYRQTGNGRWVEDRCGFIHEDIERLFPQLKKFIPLHLCNYLGHPMYPEVNGQYFIREKGKEVAMEQLRITEKEYDILSLAADDEERPYFKYLLFSLGIVDRWKQEADEFIKFLEEKTGNMWVNPYKPEEERNIMRLTEDERNEIKKKIDEGYYSVEAQKARREARYKAAKDAIRNRIIERYEETERKAREERDIKLYIFDSGMPIDNVIYYDHTKQVVFNWQDWEKKVTQEQFVDFVNKVDYSKLPEGVTFHFGKDDRKK